MTEYICTVNIVIFHDDFLWCFLEICIYHMMYREPWSYAFMYFSIRSRQFVTTLRDGLML